MCSFLLLGGLFCSGQHLVCLFMCSCHSRILLILQLFKLLLLILGINLLFFSQLIFLLLELFICFTGLPLSFLFCLCRFLLFFDKLLLIGLFLLLHLLLSIGLVG